ncbi:MAG: NifU family protein [Cryomorphaceae bacterium]|nr:NifU family protein [Cryomorphaceae bacterium]
MNKEEITSKVHTALEEIRPFLQSDGGDITLVDITDDLTVVVKLHGACIGCRVNQMTLKSGVEMTIKKYIPNINKVVQEGATTDA